MTDQPSSFPSSSAMRKPVADLVATRIAAVQTTLAEAMELGSGCPDKLRDAMQTSLLGPGKRFRPLLVLLACEAVGGDWMRALPAATAVEMIHAYTLIHDDLPALDNDDLRRGLPTCHVRFGEAMAILAGDALQALAFEMLARLDSPAAVAVTVRTLAKACGGGALVGGQADDISVLTASVDRSPDELKRLVDAIHHRKTGALIEASLEIGAAVAGATAEQAASLRHYGRAFGLAFQITDDLLDWIGDEAVVGKRLRKDGQRNKLTYPALLGVEEAKREAERHIDTACHALTIFPPSLATEALAAHAQLLATRKR